MYNDVDVNIILTSKIWKIERESTIMLFQQKRNGPFLNNCQDGIIVKIVTIVAVIAGVDSINFLFLRKSIELIPNMNVKDINKNVCIGVIIYLTFQVNQHLLI